MAEIGYFGVIIPSQDYYQGFFLRDEVFVEAQQFLDTVRKTLGGRYTPSSITARPAPDVAPEDQEWVGAISATVSNLAFKMKYQELAVPALALYLVSGYKHFIIVADFEKSNTATTIENLPDAKNADDVRAIINSHPLVLGIQMKLLRKMMKPR